MLASAGLGILGIKKRNTLISKSPQVSDGFGCFRALKDVQKKALATDRRQRRHELSREATVPGGKVPRISPSWAKNGNSATLRNGPGGSATIPSLLS